MLFQAAHNWCEHFHFEICHLPRRVAANVNSVPICFLGHHQRPSKSQVSIYFPPPAHLLFSLAGFMPETIRSSFIGFLFRRFDSLPSRLPPLSPVVTSTTAALLDGRQRHCGVTRFSLFPLHGCCYGHPNLAAPDLTGLSFLLSLTVMLYHVKRAGFFHLGKRLLYLEILLASI